MSDQIENTADLEETKEVKLQKLVNSAINIYSYRDGNPWNSADVDKMDVDVFKDDRKFKKVIDTCRFFYTHDALSATVINKLVEIGINKLEFSQSGLSDNEFRIFLAIEQKLKEFAENMALEYLISGLVVPEYKIVAITKAQVKELGIKKHDTLNLPETLWLRDPSTITINKTFASESPSYFIEIDEATLYFIMHKGVYPDGTEDKELFEQLQKAYPDFVTEVREGKRKFKIENTKNIVRRKVLSNSPYPIPFLFPAIESLKHKRNLRRMDYAIASRVISAILLVKLGSDEFPVLEDDQEQFDSIRNQMLWRNTNEKDIERIFMLFGNHTLDLEWVFPDTNALLNENKYKDVNQDIIFALGFPRILITGETERSNSSDAQYATMSPVQTMNNMREKILSVIRNLVQEIADENNLKTAPTVTFKPLQLSEFAVFSSSLLQLYDRGNISRSSIDEYFGFNFDDEFEKRKDEFTKLKDSGLPEFAPTPNSRTPENGGRGTPDGNTKNDSGRPAGSPNKND